MVPADQNRGRDKYLPFLPEKLAVFYSRKLKQVSALTKAMEPLIVLVVAVMLELLFSFTTYVRPCCWRSKEKALLDLKNNQSRPDSRTTSFDHLSWGVGVRSEGK